MYSPLSPFGDVTYKSGLTPNQQNITKVTFGLPLLPWLNRFLSIRTIWTKMTQTPHFDKDKNPTGLTALIVVSPTHIPRSQYCINLNVLSTSKNVSPK
jgi:hypothetical protein